MKHLFTLCLVLLLAACGGRTSQSTSTEEMSVSSFKAAVKGTVTGDFSGAGSTFKQSEGGLLIRLIDTHGTSGVGITIILPVGTVAGTYAPKSYDEAYDSTTNKITAVGASFSVRNQTNGTDIYAVITDSELILQSLDPMTGSIHFKAKLKSGGEVEVSATFYQLIAV